LENEGEAEAEKKRGRREEVLERRRTHQKLSRMVLEGSRYRETVEVQGIDGNYYMVDVYALTDEEFRDLIVKASLKREDLQNPEKIVELLTVQREIAAKCVRGEGDVKFTAEELGRLLMPLEYVKIFRKVLEISGIIPSALTQAVASFREKQV
jgi:hypothetical protein